MSAKRTLDRQMAHVAPTDRIAELERENAILRARLDAELPHIAARELAKRLAWIRAMKDACA